MTTLQRITDSFRNRFVKGAAITAAAIIGFTAMGDTAQARHNSAGQPGLSIELAHGGHGKYRAYRTECVAKAFRRNGRKLRGTRGLAVRKNRRRACRVAMRECRERLNHRRYATGRAFPYARCEVTRVDRVAYKNRGHHHGHGHKKGWGGIVLKF